VVLPPEAEKKIPSTATAEVTLDRNLTARNAPPRDSGKIPPLLFEGYDAVENDGEIIGRTLQDWNWVFARALLDLLEPKHVDDRFVGAWYHATSAFMFGKRLIGEASKHLDRAVAFLPDDARILLDRACLTEMQGLPRSQQVLSNEDLVGLRLSGQSGQQSSGGLVRVGSGAQQTGRTMEVANAEAERLFRRALDLDPRLFEARLRLARLLILRTRYAEGLAILHAAPAGSAPSDKIGVFYVHLFSARAERALGHLDAAADHAREALALFPDAQSAMMASSQIAMLRADAAGAEAPLRHLATLPADTTKRLDPWWGYDLFTGRDPRPILREMWAQVATGVARVKAERLLP
jgi:tetratricopeptide (TPR) repeat protein